MPKKKKRRRPSPDDPSEASPGEASYVCPTCGEQIVIPLDPTAGNNQSYVEDCPVCCNPNLIHVECDADWESPRIWAEAE